MSNTDGRPDWPMTPAWQPAPVQPTPTAYPPAPVQYPPMPYPAMAYPAAPAQYPQAPYPPVQYPPVQYPQAYIQAPYQPQPYVQAPYQPQPYVQAPDAQYASLPPYVTYQPPPPPKKKSFLPTELKEHQSFFQVPARRWWWGLIALVSYACAYVVMLLVVSLIIYQLQPEWNPDVTTPTSFLLNNLAISTDILLCPLIAWLFYRQGFGWFVSVVGRVRWRWLFIALGVFALGYAIEMLIEVVLAGPANYGFQELTPQPYTWFMIGTIILTTPLQSAAEEFQFRGLLSRLVAGIVPFRHVGLILSAVLTSLGFMTLHFADDHWLQLNYFCVGLMMWWLAYRTGGIEAPIAFHIVNNLFSEWMMPFTDISGTFDRSEGTASWTVLIYLAFQLLLVVLVDVVARRHGVVRLSAPAAEPPIVVKPRHWITHETTEAQPAAPSDVRPAPGVILPQAGPQPPQPVIPPQAGPPSNPVLPH